MPSHKVSKQLVEEFIKESDDTIFKSELKNFAVLFEGKKSEDYDDHLDEFNEAAHEFKDDVKFVFIDTEVEKNWQVIEYLGIIAEEVPTVMFISLISGLKKYKANFTTIDKSSIISFTRSCLTGKELAFLKSEDIPNNWDANPVKVLVGKSFEDLVFNDQRLSLVLFYAPWCLACQNLMPEIEKLGETYKKDENILIAKMNSIDNDVSSVTVFNVPTIALFVNGNRKAIFYDDDDRSYEKLREFIARYIKIAKLNEKDDLSLADSEEASSCKDKKKSRENVKTKEIQSDDETVSSSDDRKDTDEKNRIVVEKKAKKLTKSDKGKAGTDKNGAPKKRNENVKSKEKDKTKIKDSKVAAKKGKRKGDKKDEL